MINTLIYQTYTINGKPEKYQTKKKQFKILAPTWNVEFELPDGQYSVSDIQDYFKYILKIPQ